jgi:hypothetical protein
MDVCKYSVMEQDGVRTARSKHVWKSMEKHTSAKGKFLTSAAVLGRVCGLGEGRKEGRKEKNQLESFDK